MELFGQHNTTFLKLWTKTLNLKLYTGVISYNYLLIQIKHYDMSSLSKVIIITIHDNNKS